MLHTWFTESAARDPDAAALVVEGRTYSYAELDALSRGIAHRIREQKQDRPRVGLIATRSVAAYAAYLAVLRLGGVVVPLNDAYPAPRLTSIARAARLDLVIADREQNTAFAAGLDLRVLRLGPDALRGLLRYDGSGEDHRGDPGDLAYLLFTSGSTGRPKGVPIRHCGLDAFLHHNIERYWVGPGSRLSQTFHLAFDPSVFDLFVAWGGGATLVVPTADELFDPAAFVTRAGITHWFSVPSVISSARRLGRLSPGSMPGLRWSLFCGERFTLEQARAWAAAAPGSVVENLYGPTELTVTVSAGRLPADPAAWPATANGTVPIGEVYPHLDHRIDAGTGELQVRGPQMFDGYLEPDDTRGVFAPDPGGAWYRTGDRVAVTANGLLHLGRVDHQVKILGHRVELQEAEGLLRSCQGVEDAVVSVIEDARRGTVLAAIYTGKPSTSRRLREQLRALLPPAVVPKRFVHVERLPLNDRGKVDREACARLLAG